MICRFSVDLSLFRPDEGWLVLLPRNDISEIELVLKRSINVPSNVISTILPSSVRTLCSITSIVFTMNDLEYTSICIGDACFSASRCTSAKSAVYGVPVRIEVQVESNVFSLFELAKVLRPRVMAMLGLSKIGEIRLRTSADYRDALKNVRIKYEYPILRKLPDVLTRDVARVMSDQAIIKNFEDYVLGLGTEHTARFLRSNGILTEDNMLTRLGQVLMLCLAPYAVTNDQLQSLIELVQDIEKKK